MKELSEYSKQEIALWTPEMVDDYTKRVCMESGWPFEIVPMPPAPTDPREKMDVTIYRVKSMDFANREDAEAVAEVLRGKAQVSTSYMVNYGAPYYITSVAIPEEIDVTPRNVFSNQRGLALKAEYAKYQDEKTAYDKASKSNEDTLRM